VRILVFAEGEDANIAREAGADDEARCGRDHGRGAAPPGAPRGDQGERPLEQRLEPDRQARHRADPTNPQQNSGHE
jgi:hypothetical protein